MKNVLLLTKLGLLSSWGGGRKSKKRRSQSVMLALMGIGTLLLIALMGLYAWGLSMLVELAGAPTLMISMGFLLGAVISVFFGIAKTPGMLFAAKDFETLMSLPLKEREVFFSKLLMVYFSHMTGMVTVALPFSVVYGIRFGGEAGYYVMMVLALLLVPFLLMVVSSLISLLIARIAQRFRHTNAVMLVLTLVAICAILAGSMLLGTVGESDMIAALAGMDRSLSAFPLTAWIIGTLQGSGAALLKLALLSLLPFAALTVVFAKTYRRINSALCERRSRGGYRLGAMRSASPVKALRRREIKSYFSQYYYVFNTAVGGLMLLILTVLLVIGGPKVIGQIVSSGGEAVVSGMLLPLLVLIECFCVMVGCTTASSISLEGSRIWILQSLPVTAKEIFRSKLAVQLLITLPVLPIVTVAAALVLGLTLAESLTLLIVPALAALLTGLTGLITNLLFPMLDWKNPMIPVKRGASVMVTMLACFAVMAIGGVAYWKIGGDFVIFCAVAAVVLAVLCAAAWRWLCTAGAKRFAQL